MAAALRKRLVGLGSQLVRGQRPWRGLQPLEPARLQQTRCFSRSSRSDAIVGETEFARGMVLPITTSLEPINPDEQDRIPVYRMVQEDGTLCEGLSQEPDEMLGLDRDQVLSMYQHMLRVMAMDKVFYDAQRQGRISFYMQNAGEEGVQIGTAAGLEADDPINAQYREAGVLMWRGYTLQDFADQCFSNEDDPGKGRQMPVHYGSKDLNFFTISSPLTTQVPQAAGVGYALKQEGKGRVSVVYFGEGAASEGDFHAGMNIACTLECPVIFVCRNNGYAISTPTEDQYRGDGIAPRGVAYGMRTIRVDGNDTFAVLHATKEARKYASEESKPVLIETMAYREGHHSTSDDSTAYREPEEIARFRAKMNPVFRMRQFLERRGWWDDEKEKAASKLERRAVLKALTAAEGKPKPGMEHLFTDVYAGDMPWHLKEQKEQLEEHVAKYPEHYQGGH